MRAPKKQPNGYYWDPPDKEWIYKAYVTKYMTGREIASRIGATRPTVLSWVRMYDIPVKQACIRIPEKYSERQVRVVARQDLEDSERPDICYVCGTSKRKLDCHHLDGDLYNYDLDNLRWLCRSCHTRVHRPTPPWVLKARRMLSAGKLAQWEIAAILGVSDSRISKIKLGKIWAE